MRMDISNGTLLPATLTLLLSAFFHQASAAPAQAQDDANAAGKKLLEELYPRYCNGDIVKPGVHARLVTGEPLTNEACKRMRGQLEAYNAAPDGVPLARAPYVGDQQGLKYAYSHMCVGDRLQPKVAAGYAHSKMAKYGPTDGTCKSMHGLLFGDPIEGLEGYVADMKQRAGFRDADMPIEHAQIELLRHDPQRAQPYIFAMEPEALGNFGFPRDSQMMATGNLLDGQYVSPGTLAPSLAVLFDLHVASSNQESRANALQMILAVKSADLIRATERLRSIQESGRHADSAALVEQLRKAYARAASVWVQAALHQSAPATAPFDAAIYAIRSLEQQLASHLPAAGATPFGPRVAEVREMLGQNDALVEFSTVWLPSYRRDVIPAIPAKVDSKEIYYVAYVLTGAGKISGYELGTVDAVDSALKKYRCQMQEMPGIGSDGPKKAANPLYQTLWRPLTESLAAVHSANGHVYIAPDGALSSLPFDALMDDENKFLIETWRISYLASGADLVRGSAKFPGGDVGKGSEVAVFLRLQPLGKWSNEEVQGDCGGGASGLPSNYIGLAGTQVEGAAIQRSFPDARVFGAKDHNAGAPSESTLKHLANPRVLHFATHGYYIEAQPAREALIPLNRRAPYSLLRSGVILDEFGSQGGAEDGILSGLEIAGLDLHATDLVVLSACDTGLRDGLPGDGVAGLRNAFRIAGAKSVVSALWSVEDEAAPRLMNDFYSGLANGETVDNALRSAKQAMLHQDRYRHPFFWASFVLDGRTDVCLRGKCTSH